MRNVTRFLPWLLVACSFAFALATWADLPSELPLRLKADGSAGRVTEKSFFAWFGLPMVALVTVGLLTGMRALIPSRPELFNHPEKERFLALPRAYHGPVITELALILDVTSALVVLVVLEVQVFLFGTAMGRPSGAAMPVILVTALMTTPVILVLLSRVSAAVEVAERRWIAAGRPRA